MGRTLSQHDSPMGENHRVNSSQEPPAGAAPRVVASGLDTLVLSTPVKPLQSVVDTVARALAADPRQNAPRKVRIGRIEFAVCHDKHSPIYWYEMTWQGITVSLGKHQYPGPYPVKLRISAQLLWTTDPT